MEKRPPKVGLSFLNRLPLEIIDPIISVLVIKAADHFRAANKRAFQVVNAHLQFGLLVWEAQEVLRGLYAIKLAATATVETLVAKLSESRCVECGDFGGCMYLMTFERVCAWCAQKTDRFAAFESVPGWAYGNGPSVGYYLPLFDRESVLKAALARHGSEEAVRGFHAGMGPDVIQSFPKNIDERERMHDEAKFRKQRADAVRHRAYARKRIEAKKPKWEKYFKRREARRKKVEDGVPFPAEDEEEDEVEDEDDLSTDEDPDAWSDLEPEEDAMPKVLQAAKEERDFSAKYDYTYARSMEGKPDDLSEFDNESLRFAALLRIPWLNLQSRRAEWGFHCIGCLRKRWLHSNTPMDNDKPTYFRRDFLVSTFEQHLKDSAYLQQKTPLLQ
ncbi:hypothetical protein EDB81DRAFT_874761 [Dactylonectria macrodidyma]|uniref:F-box domain-containing protein n=1 Tax=Dactylonectria macrodidyma TaxID=307937 RepID=A0A9P9FRI8_9HYPO|nr:hypothetical protein EDB81DRAFT_874761 [Dactylonectria macrodidyma]